MIPVRVDISDTRALVRALKLIERRTTQTQVLTRAMVPGAEYVVEVAKREVPVDKGFLRASIGYSRFRRVRRSQAKIIVGHDERDPHKRWKISHIVHWGSIKQAANPYMTRAMDVARARYTELVTTSLIREITRELVKVGFRRGRAASSLSRSARRRREGLS